MSCRCDMPPFAKACHCRVCCLTFTGPTAFDRHILHGKHQDPSTCGLVQNHRGAWGKPAGTRPEGVWRHV